MSSSSWEMLAERLKSSRREMPSVKLIELGDITWNLCHAIKEFGYREGIQEGQTHFQGNSKLSMMI